MLKLICYDCSYGLFLDFGFGLLMINFYNEFCFFFVTGDVCCYILIEVNYRQILPILYRGCDQSLYNSATHRETLMITTNASKRL